MTHSRFYSVPANTIRTLSCGVALALALPTLVGCDMITEKLTEKAAEAALEAVTDAEDVDIDTSSGKTTIKTKDGVMEAHNKGDGEVVVKGADGSHMRTGGEVPKDFPLPVVDAQKVLQSIDSKGKKERTRMLVMLAESKDLKELDKLYTEALEKIGGDVTRTEMNQEKGQMIMLGVKNKETKVTASVQLTFDPKAEGVTVMATHSSSVE